MCAKLHTSGIDDVMRDIDNAINDSEIDIDCPECDEEFLIKISDIGSTVKCPHCGVDIKLEG